MEAPLNERLTAYSEKLRELSFPFSEAYDALVARLFAGDRQQGAGCRRDHAGLYSPQQSGPAS